MMIPLTKQQKEIIKEFYCLPATKVILNKTERNKLWNKAKYRSSDLDFAWLKEKCPALEHQIAKSYSSGKNIQSAVFSECVYAQTFANMMNLNLFINCFEQSNFIPAPVVSLLSSYHLVPRYVYSSSDKKRMLIQAGGCDGVDSALITVIDLVIYTIEFKEPGAKTGEYDLPRYKEDGVLVVTEKWLENHPQFKPMLDEQKGLNFFKNIGHNINDFSEKSVDFAVSNCYTNTKKYADVICTEDKKGNLVMIPTNQVSVWADDIKGEIRTAGRNSCYAWTPIALRRFLLEKGASICNDVVTISKCNLAQRMERAGNRTVSGYKINPLFFIYKIDCTENNGILTFEFKKVRQLKPTIAGKISFKNLLHSKVKTYYGL